MLGLAPICWAIWKTRNHAYFDKKHVNGPIEILFTPTQTKVAPVLMIKDAVPEEGAVEEEGASRPGIKCFVMFARVLLLLPV
jgi:hypothetical protein